MEFKDRQAAHPGRITLRKVNGQTDTYDVIAADEATEQGTPLNAATMAAFKTDILNEAKKMIPSEQPIINYITVITKGNEIY